MDEKDRIRIRRIIQKRRVADDTFSYICSISPEKATADEIADKINASRTSVLGALRGLGSRYREDESLMHFGFAAFEKTRNTRNNKSVIVYGVTLLGLEERGLSGNHGNRNKNNPENVKPTTEEG